MAIGSAGQIPGGRKYSLYKKESGRKEGRKEGRNKSRHFASLKFLFPSRPGSPLINPTKRINISPAERGGYVDRKVAR